MNENDSLVDPLIDAYAIAEELSGRVTQYIDNSHGRRYVFKFPYTSMYIRVSYISLYSDKVVFFLGALTAELAKVMFDDLDYKFAVWQQEVESAKSKSSIKSTRFSIYFDKPEQIIEFNKNFKNTMKTIELMYLDNI